MAVSISAMGFAELVALFVARIADRTAGRGSENAPVEVISNHQMTPH